MTGRITRRGFLGLGLGASLATLLGGCRGAAEDRSVDLGALREVYDDRAALDALGRHAVTRAEVGDDARAVERALRPAGVGADWLRTSSPAEMRRDLRAAIDADFTAARIVDVAGWQLPVTEARVAALFHLVS